MGFEVLEDRRMLSVTPPSVIWTNRDLGVNNFSLAFGNYADQAKAVIDTAIADWERVITSFNYTNLNQTYNVNISMSDSPVSPQAGVGGHTSIDQSALVAATKGLTPSGAHIVIDWKSWLPDNSPQNIAAGYYLDPNPHDFSDFEGIITGVGIDGDDTTNAFVGGSNVIYPDVPSKKYDLYTVVEHELGHAFGIYSNAPQLLAAAHNTVTDGSPNGTPDRQNLIPATDQSPAHTIGFYWTVDTANVHTLFTSVNGTKDSGGPIHFADSGAFYTSSSGRDYYGATRLMNASSSTEHKLIDDTVALLLQDLYGYTIQLPSSIATFYDTLDADGTLRIDLRSLDLYDSFDHIDLSSNNGVLQVLMVPETPVPGIDPSEFDSKFDLYDPTSAPHGVKQIDIKLGKGDDTIEIHPLSSPIPIYIDENANEGNDDLVIDGSPGHDVFEVDAPTIRSSGIFVASYGEMENLRFFTQSGGADIYAANTTTITHFKVFGASPGEIIDLHSLDENTLATIDCGDGDDVIFLDPSATSGFGSIQSRVTIKGNGGADRLHVGMGSLDGIVPNGFEADVIFDGGADNDTLYLDDYADGGATKWTVGPEKVLREKLNLVEEETDYSGVEAVTLYTGLGGTLGNTINVKGSFNSDLSIQGGSGSDTLNLKDFKNRYDVSPEILTYAANFDLGGGLNFLDVDETAGLFTTFDLSPTQLTYLSFFAVGDTIINFANISGGVTINASDDSNTVSIHGVSTTFSGYQNTILTNGGEDQFFLYPHDDAGNLTFNGNLGLGGGDDSDSVTIDDSASLLPIDYRFSNFFGPGTTNVSGLGSAPIGVGGDVEMLNVNAGGGGDTFSMDSYLSPSTTLSIAAGEGADLLEFAPFYEDLGPSFFNPTTVFSFDGGGGTDTVKLYNNAAVGTWFYTRVGDLFFTQRVDLPRPLFLNTTSAENVSVSGDAQDDIFFVETVLSGETLTFEGGGGIDAFEVGLDLRNAKLVQGQVILDGGADGGRLYVFDTANTTGSIFHIEDGVDGTLGSTAGDTLFGTGGSLQFRNLADSPAGLGLNLTLGSGPDTIYARPQTTVTMEIDAGEPSEGVGDTLNLLLSQAQNAAVQITGVGAGNVTSSNRKPIQWTGIENLNSAATEPTGFLVTNTLDSGAGSLRQAMLDANATPNIGGPDVIRFSIPGVGAHTIQPLSPLPGITDPVVIDATTQSGYAGAPVIELDGSLAHGGNGLFITSGGTTVRGLAINRFVSGANGEIWMQGLGGNVIQGNYLGTNLAGTAAFPLASQASYGVIIFGSDDNVIGTDGDGTGDAAEGNVISGHNTAGVLLELGQPGELPENNVIAGNRIGTSADGNTVLGNGRMGVFLISGTGTRIGTNSDGVSDTLERNLISGNPEAGVYISDNGNIVAGNFIGTNPIGNASLPNGDGVITQNASNNRIGGMAPGAGNLIAFSTHDGVIIDKLGTGNSILGNSIYANSQLGINLNAAGQLPSGVTPNDANDADTGPNNLQNFPQIATAFSSGTQTTVGGTLQSTPNTTFRVEFFSSPVADPSGFGEGEFYLGFATVTTDGNGTASFATTLSTVALVGQALSATATDPSGNTSEFSASVQVLDSNSLTNVAILQNPVTSKTFFVTSPTGTAITASVATTSTVAPPAGVSFPLGFVTFQITNLQPGASADVTISGLDTSSIGDYYKYGATPAVGTQHWYDYLFGHQTDFDSASGTGMEIVGGNLVLHLVDGGRGDDDVTANGIISDIGGPVTVNVASITSTHTVISSDHASGAIYGQNLHFTATVSPNSGSSTATGFVQFQVDGHNFGAARQL
ncbi:MAG TPA: choice-of-anchor U domain-containing protein, partial [Lacipirellulaceae bacterium]